MTEENVENNVESEKSGKGPWGFWGTIGFTFLLLVAFVIFQTITFFVFAVVQNIRLEDPEALQKLGNDGLLLSLCTCISAIFCIPLATFFGSMRSPVKEYFALNPVKFKTVAFWCLLALGFSGTTDLIKWYLQVPVVPDFMIEAYNTVGFVPLLFLGLVVAAPLSEEFIFRGFMMRGLLESSGPTVAIILTSLVFAGIHLQYDLVDMGIVFAFGVFMALARYKTNSIWTAIYMHATLNLLATLEVVFLK